jgi:heme exporter protein D
LKVAVTLWLAFIVTLQVSAVPLHAPVQPAKTTFLLDGLAVRVTLVPLLKLAEHSVPQLMPLGLLVTLPEPLFTTLRV